MFAYFGKQVSLVPLLKVTHERTLRVVLSPSPSTIRNGRFPAQTGLDGESFERCLSDRMTISTTDEHIASVLLPNHGERSQFGTSD
jgi:hypothetical protein